MTKEGADVKKKHNFVSKLPKPRETSAESTDSSKYLSKIPVLSKYSPERIPLTNFEKSNERKGSLIPRI